MNLLVVSFVWNICIGVRIARDSTFRRIDIMMRELMGWRSLVGRGWYDVCIMMISALLLMRLLSERKDEILILVTIFWII